MKVRRASLISITQGSFEWFRLPPSCLRWKGGGCWLRIRTERFPPLFGCQDTRALFVRSDGEQSNLFSPLDNSRSFGPFVTFFLFLSLPFPRDATDVRVSAQTRAADSTALGLYTFSISQTPLLSFFLLSIPISFMILFIVLRRVCGQRPIVCYVEKARNRFLEYKASMSFVQRIVLTLYKLRRRRRLYRFLHNSISFRTLRSDVSFFIHQLSSPPPITW